MFDSARFISESLPKIREQIGSGKAMIALSGGVDSTTASVLVNKAIGKNLLCVFVDTGYMRKHEPERMQELGKKLGLNLKIVDASQ